MRKVAILLALTMMLAGCTELAEDSTESETYTNQDLEGSYYGFTGFRVDMNADDTYTVYIKELEDCYDDAETAAGEVSESDDDELVVDGNCIYEEYPVDGEDDITVSSTLGSHMGVPYLMLTVNGDSDFVCDDGYEIPADWVNDGEEDCSDGEDEAEDASDSIGTQKIADVYFSADGFGMLNYEESVVDEMFSCLLLAPTNTRELDMQAYELMEELMEDDDIDEDDPMSSIPSEVIALYASLDEDYSNSPLSSLVPGCGEDTSFVMSSLIFGVWANSLAESNTGGDFVMYNFDISDASGAPTSGSGDDLVYIQMTQGDELAWPDIDVQMSVDGGPYYPCTNPVQASDTGCAVSDNDDGWWVLGEDITISEGSDNLCDGSCEIQVRILDSAESMLIYESNPITVE
tara:strand:+ start:1194 stop:2405 length:1212 start_codon:yes stop_codon:yes gene_type:complete